MKYIYMISNDKAIHITTTYDEVSEDEILKAYPESIIKTEYIQKPYIKDGEIVESIEDFYTIYYDENGEITELIDGFTYEDDRSFICIEKSQFKQEDIQFYTVVDGLLKFNTRAKNKALKEQEKKQLEDMKLVLLEKANELKQHAGDVGFIYKDNLRQPCREQDKTSVTAKAVELQFTQRNECEWKFFDKDTGEHIYTTISILELAKIGQTIGSIILKAMKAESRIIEDLKAIEDIENLKAYDIAAKFEEYFNN